VAAAHLGFQVTVDLVVYPALGEVAADGWAAAHDRHSRRITPVVALLYPALVGVLAWSIVSAPGEIGAWVALVGGAVALVTTAAVAAPVHGRLGGAGSAERQQLLQRLGRADRVRTVGALVCAAGALLLVG
jgi:hypothetical protein